jgi:hypothetical protein
LLIPGIARGGSKLRKIFEFNAAAMGSRDDFA